MTAIIPAAASRADRLRSALDVRSRQIVDFVSVVPLIMNQENRHRHVFTTRELDQHRRRYHSGRLFHPTGQPRRQGFISWGGMAGERTLGWLLRGVGRGAFGMPHCCDSVGLEVGSWGRTRRMQAHCGACLDTRGLARSSEKMMRTVIRADVYWTQSDVPDMAVGAGAMRHSAVGIAARRPPVPEVTSTVTFQMHNPDGSD
ncbi:hypothetical protein B0J13DRAFT_639492 [Dactylonectria estremocensis]|uniref:Uncharacterized protein n=1 Tax=Dactylonectria estremocensis TaxID=1079267 RepID=A0A9P9J0N3_9HYPO|nr:hypothetical protein B0J13DRAFT_639492 [Dactylonectria estremocensis]